MNGFILNGNTSPLSSASEHLAKKSINALLTTLGTATGHPDKHLLGYAKAKKEKLLSKTGEVVAKVDNTLAVCLNGKTYLETITSTYLLYNASAWVKMLFLHCIP